jgi:tetratricopeptide (TPR) repeat protein
VVAGTIIPHEVPEQFALHVARALQLVHAWAAGPDVSGALFDPEDLERWEADVLRTTGVDEGIWAPVAVIAGELAHPAEVDPEQLAHACLAMTDWALGRTAEGTAVMFAEAAAAVWPNNARIAWIAGRIYRDRGQFSRAETWLRHASRVAVQSGDWELHAQAINSLGNLKLHLGDLASARELLLAAARVAKRKQLRERHAMVLHDLFVVSVYSGRFDEADAHARQAFAAYGPDHPKAVNLAFDVSHFCTQQGQFARALQVLEPLRDRFTDPDRRLRVLASIARAAGEAGDAVSFQACWLQAWSLIDNGDVAAIRPAAALELGLGAVALGLREQAEAALSSARDGARALRDEITLPLANSALQKLGQPAGRAAPRPRGIPRTAATDVAWRIARTPDAPERIESDAN